MPTVLLIETERASLRMSALARSFPDPSDSWNANWVDCEIAARTGGLSANVRLSIRSPDLERLRELLLQLDAAPGEAHFQPMSDPPFELFIVRTLRGAVSIKAVVRAANETLDELVVTLEIDQTWLRPLLAQVDEVLALFPVLGR